MRRFFIESTTPIDGLIALSRTDSKHISTVLRLKTGTSIVLFDGQGAEYEAQLVCVSSHQVSASILRRLVANSEAPISITIAQGFLKEKKMDDLIRALTELGITRWVPFFTERSIPRPTADRLISREDRWRTISKEALKQCRRNRLPEIFSVGSLNDVIALGSDNELKIVFWENAVKPVNSAMVPISNKSYRSVFVLIGPEGGFSEAEIKSATTAGFIPATLGPRILRAETATLSACSIIQYLIGDMGKDREEASHGFSYKAPRNLAKTVERCPQGKVS